MKHLFLSILAVLLIFGCATNNGAMNDVLQESAVSTSAYLICKSNPQAIPSVMMVCKAPDDQLAIYLAELYAKYGEAIDDPFLQLQIEILLQAFADQYGIDIADPAFDLTTINGADLRPFVDTICMGALAAESAQ